jgi:hydrogenase nickel incorporation protein HypB
MNPDVTIIPVSAKTGEGLEAWFDWVCSQIERSPIPEQQLSVIH